MLLSLYPRIQQLNLALNAAIQRQAGNLEPRLLPPLDEVGPLHVGIPRTPDRVPILPLAPRHGVDAHGLLAIAPLHPPPNERHPTATSATYVCSWFSLS